MREILFRGFHKCEDGDTTIFVDGREVRGRWVEGLPYYRGNDIVFMLMPLPLEEIKEVKDEKGKKFYDIVFSFKEVFSSTVGQYTGLTDKNGKKIFEGDIVKEIYYCLDERIESATYNVAWNDFCVGFHLIFETERTEKTTYLTKNGMYEISGTIFDKPQEGMTDGLKR